MRGGNLMSTNNYWLTPLFYLIGELGATVANCLAAAQGFDPLFRYAVMSFHNSAGGRPGAMGPAG
jgi:hypothetical protein